MKSFKQVLSLCCAFAVMTWLSASSCVAQETATKPKQEKGSAKQGEKQEDKKAKPIVVEVRDGNIRFKASGTWKKVKPRSRIVEFEIKVPKVEGDKNDGRLTIMGAGGSIEANIERWYGQFTQPDGGATKEKSKVKEEKINGQKVTMVDITGTFLDKPGGPFAGGKTIERQDYRMLAAIVQTEKDGNYFVKLYGPNKTITKNEKHFKAMIKSVDVAR